MDEERNAYYEVSAPSPVYMHGRDRRRLYSWTARESELRKPLVWDYSTDPNNPKNWTFPSRIFHTAVPALFGFVM